MSVRLDNLEPIDRRPIRRALVSVYDKTGLEDLGRALTAAGVEIVSTGSTAARLASADVPVTPVEAVTGFPEVLEGRVKTLHPKIHAGILADQRKADHRVQLNHLGVEAFDLVVCNLYPFEQTVASGARFDECVEQIDIGGPSMVRAAAKNHPSVAVVVSPEHYEDVAAAAAGEGFTLEERQNLAAEAFVHTATYDFAIAEWFADQLGRDDLADELDDAVTGGFASELDDVSDAVARLILGEDAEELDTEDAEELSDSGLPDHVMLTFERAEDLRYGENPHQDAAVYVDLDSPSLDADPEDDEDGPAAPGIANAIQLHGKPMSYNNFTDGDAALRAAYDHAEPCVAIIKHANPCGIAVADTVAEAHRLAHACDPVSAFGGVIAVNRPVTVELAEQIVPIFTEVVLAPAFEEGAVEVLSRKKNLRVLQVLPPERGATEFKQISGGLLVQRRDDIDAPGDDPANWDLVSGDAADASTMADLVFAWRTVRAVRSNAILLVRDRASVGVGMGQVNRVDSCRLAVERANTLGGRSTGDAAVGAGAGGSVDSAGGARAEDVVADVPEQRAIGSVAASDAFFPFADGLQVLIDAGVKAVVQPGGSVRDQESIDAAKAAGITMYMTGTRHFAH